MSQRRIELRKVAIVVKPQLDEITLLTPLVEWLRRRGVEPAVEKRVADQVGGVGESFPPRKPPHDADLIIVLGGDGTLLSVVRSLGSRQIPILGVNVGSLGFLTDVALSDLYPALESVQAGNFRIESRMMLSGELFRNGKLVTKQTVLNDVVITKGAIARMIEVGVEINDQFVATIRADGIIVSTPTGSTAYSLAAGGPILYPAIRSMILTPICPHTLTYRPVVVSDRSRVKLTLRAKSGEVYLTFDGQVSVPMHQGDMVRVRKNRSRLRLVNLPGHNYFQVLRHKLRWAERPRSPNDSAGTGPTQ